MALIQEEALNYLKLVPLVQELPKRPFSVVYDAEADVLYIDFHNPPCASDDTELTDNDVIIRYGEGEEVVGLTVLHASSR